MEKNQTSTMFSVFDVTVENTSGIVGCHFMDLTSNKDAAYYDENGLFDDEFSAGDSVNGELIFEIVYDDQDIPEIHWDFDEGEFE